MSLEKQFLDCSKEELKKQNRGWELDIQIIGNVSTMVKLRTSFPHLFEIIKFDGHTSVLVFQPRQHIFNSENINRLYKCLNLYATERFLLFSQEGMSICSINTSRENEAVKVTDPATIKEIVSRTNEVKRVHECRKSNITAVLGHTRINIDNVCDIRGYFDYINPELEDSLLNAFKDLEDFYCQKERSELQPNTIESILENAQNNSTISY